MKNFHVLDICLPDFFAGHHLPVIQILWDGAELTKAEVMEKIKEEYNYCFELYEQYEEHFEEAKKEFLKDNPEGVYINGNIDVEEAANEGEEYPYIYFVLGEIETDRLGFNYVV